MVHIDALYLLLLVEALLASALFSLFLIRRLMNIRRMKAKAERQEEDFRLSLEKQITEKLKEVATLGQEVEILKAEKETQGKRIGDLLGHQNLFVKSQKKIEAIQKGNRELKEKLVELSEKAGTLEAVQDALNMFEENNKELEACLGDLEKENERLSGEVETWESKEEEQAYRKKLEEEKYGRILEEKKALKSRISELEETINAKDKELKALDYEFKALEKEYRALYNEHEQAN